MANPYRRPWPRPPVVRALDAEPVLRGPRIVLTSPAETDPPPERAPTGLALAGYLLACFAAGFLTGGGRR